MNVPIFPHHLPLETSQVDVGAGVEGLPVVVGLVGVAVAEMLVETEVEVLVGRIGVEVVREIGTEVGTDIEIDDEDEESLK